MKIKINKIKRKEYGFTMVELMVALFIAGILMSYAIPSYYEFGLRQNVTNRSNDLLSDLMFARATAIKQGQKIRVTSTSDGNDWSQGWAITYVTGGANIRVKQQTNQSIEIAADNNFVEFNNIGAANSAINIEISHSDTTKKIVLNVSLSGLVTSRRG